MISIDDHHHPPSSSHHQEQQQISHDHHLKINSDELDLKSLDADLDDTNNNNNPLPNFSIRDHVFGLRSKDVARNWPFSSKSLQLCLRNGVKNVLPPFQPLDLVRDNSSSITRCDLETRLAPNEELVRCFDGEPMEDRFAKSIPELPVRPVSVNSIGSKENKESNTRSKEKPPSQKKSRLVMKLNSGVEPVDQLDIAPNSFIVSETMASKVCPVCKIFSSSSNTTLNAHIDQCLTGEASMKWTDNPKVIVKHRIKPRKTRLMSDIYETAPHCTVEELDRRNGTSWATNSSFPAQEFEFQEEKEEPRLTTTINPEVADNEGDVYIDTNGTKVRILSVPKAGSSDNKGARKLLKGVKGCKIVIGKKKHNLFKAKHHQKYLKLGSKAGKLRSPKPPSNAHRDSEIVDEQITSGQEQDVAMVENCRKDEGDREPMKARVHIEESGLAIVRPPWACSKRTRLGKKFSGKRRQLVRQNDPRKDFLVESDKSSSGCEIRKKTRTSSPLTNPSSKLLRKDDTFMHNDSEGSQDSYPSRHSDGPDIRPMNSMFSSLRKNLSFSAAKTSLKRKFSAFEKSRVIRCVPNEKSVDGLSRNSLIEQSRMEEDTKRSITSKSSNGESSVGIETAIDDALPDVESVRNENNLPDDDQICAVPTTRMIDDDGHLMDLSNSFDPEFSKLVSQPDKLYDREQICSTNRAYDGKNIFGNDIEDGTEDVEKHQDYFQEVDPIDPIPIPGPPGSFLPSPGGDMVSEEIPPIRVPPSENLRNHDTIDRDSMSNSPVSTVSNPSMARSDSRSSEKLSYRSSSVQDDQRPGFSGVMIEPTFKKSFPNGGNDWRPVDQTEKGPSPTNFKNDQPCCCSRKESASSYSVASNYQDSSFLRKQQPIESMFLLNNYPTSQPPDTMVFPTTTKKSPTRVKLPIYSDCDSAASPSKPVLRLMGKNLTVVKTDEDVTSSSQQFRPPMSQMVRNDPKEDTQGYPHRPVIFSRYQNGSESNHFNGEPPINMSSSFMDRYGHGGSNFCPMIPPMRSHYGYNGANPQTPHGRNTYNSVSTSNLKEIIIIDDSSPENEADDQFLRRNHSVQMNQFYSMYQPPSSDHHRHPYGGGGPAVFRGGGYETSFGMQMGSSSSSLSSSPSNSISHLRASTAYYPPRYP
ncbi:hypothetical protein L6452_00179 [Arctium lappa]|uniref:Uncharacterized protein n=1 Tax=Arctium lappa TaxID=4217 RepID=A0ACB9FE66_ARCLA|nr:hypothetical protein L6452_00179 [Arctium lappa]